MVLTESLKQGAKATLSFFTALWMLTAVLFAAAPSLDLPSETARVERTEAGTNGKTIFLIQEAHVDYNAQKAIAEIIKHLVQKKSLRLILVEGGWGDTSLSFLRNYGSDKGRHEVAERYLKEGKISGEEYLDIISDLDMQFWGIENPEDYRRNMEVFLKLHEVQDRLLAEVEKFKKVLLSREDKVFSPAAKEFAAERRTFRENQNSLIHYAHFLRQKLAKTPPHPALSPRRGERAG